MDIRDGKVTSYQVNMMVTFVLDDQLRVLTVVC